MIRIKAVIAFICGDIPPLPVIDYINIGHIYGITNMLRSISSGYLFLMTQESIYLCF